MEGEHALHGFVGLFGLGKEQDAAGVHIETMYGTKVRQARLFPEYGLGAVAVALAGHAEQAGRLVGSKKVGVAE